MLLTDTINRIKIWLKYNKEVKIKLKYNKVKIWLKYNKEVKIKLKYNKVKI